MKKAKPSNFNNHAENKKPSSNSPQLEEYDLDENIYEMEEEVNPGLKNFEAKSKNAHLIAQEGGSRPSYVLNTHKLSDIKLTAANSALLANRSNTETKIPLLSEGKLIFLLEKSPFGVNLTQEAIDELSKYDLKASFVTIIGDQKSGKSLLLNKILDFPDGNGYIPEESEGFLMWSVPYHIKKENRLVYFVECPEISRTEAEEGLFSLIYSMSSFVIFNIMGDPGEKTLANLSTISQLSNTLKNGKKTNAPKLIWAWRDVNEKTLKQVIDGNLSHSQMIDLRFNDFSKKFSDSKRLFAVIQDYFPEKSCFYFPRAFDSAKVMNKEFLKAVERLKGFIEDQINGNVIYDTVMNARMMLTLINSGLEMMREKSSIDLAYCWSCVIENECITAYNECLDLYNGLLKEFFGTDEPRKPEELFNILQTMRDVTFEKFGFIAGVKERTEFYFSYHKKLKEVIDGKEVKSFEINEELNAEKNEKIWKDLERKVLIDYNKGLFNEKNLDGLVETYGNLGEGYSVNRILSTNLKRMNQTILHGFLLSL